MSHHRIQHPVSGSPVAPDASWTVNQLLLERPSAAAILNAFGVDSCCGGARSLAEAATEAGIEPATLLTALGADAPAGMRGDA
jgi:regulator of cell morphogenesis and NO signaling